MRKQMVVLVALLAAVIAACSDVPRLAPPPDLDPVVLPPAEPEVFASGSVTWGPASSQRFEYEIEEILGFTTAVTLRATAESKISVRSVSPEDDQDPFWLAGILFIDEAPPIVFGGADGDIDRMMLINSDGRELALELVELDSRDWLFTIQELPPSWVAQGELAMEAVALRDGTEVARKPVGLS